MAADSRRTPGYRTVYSMDLMKALRKLHPDAVLIDRKGRAWTAEDLEYTLRDDVRDEGWNRQRVVLRDDGIYRTCGEGKDEPLYLLTERVVK
jgi:hypothetical protein